MWTVCHIQVICRPTYLATTCLQLVECEGINRDKNDTSFYSTQEIPSRVHTVNSMSLSYDQERHKWRGGGKFSVIFFEDLFPSDNRRRFVCNSGWRRRPPNRCFFDPLEVKQTTSNSHLSENQDRDVET